MIFIKITIITQGVSDFLKLYEIEINFKSSVQIFLVEPTF
jgi:hypothetical protein